MKVRRSISLFLRHNSWVVTLMCDIFSSKGCVTLMGELVGKRDGIFWKKL